MLAQKLMLEADPGAFLKLANVRDAGPGGVLMGALAEAG